MNRIRSIKPEWLEDERLALASDAARVLSIALILLADDWGNGRASLVLLSGRVFPGKSPETLAKALEELANIRFILLYEIGEQSYYHIRNWDKHQKVDKPGKPRVPAPPDRSGNGSNGAPARILDALAKAPEGLAPDQDQDQDRERKGEREERERDRAPAAPAPLSLVQDFTEQRMREMFAATYRTLRKQTPSMHGHAPDLLQRVKETAAARGVSPHALFNATVHRWATGELNPRELAQPFACFAAAFGEVVDRGGGAARVDTKTALVKRSADALKRGDRDAYAAAEAELGELLQQQGDQHV